MKKQALVVAALAAAITLPMVGCGGTTNNATDTKDDAKQEQKADDSFDAVEAYMGQWRGSVETTGQTVYGSAGGTEQMLDINLEEDGTCTVVPLEAHADLLNDEGTWEGTESEVVLHLSKGDITLSVVESAKMEGNAADFDIADFDTINFDYYG